MSNELLVSFAILLRRGRTCSFLSPASLAECIDLRAAGDCVGVCELSAKPSATLYSNSNSGISTAYSSSKTFGFGASVALTRDSRFGRSIVVWVRPAGGEAVKGPEPGKAVFPVGVVSSRPLGSHILFRVRWKQSNRSRRRKNFLGCVQSEALVLSAAIHFWRRWPFQKN